MPKFAGRTNGALLEYVVELKAAIRDGNAKLEALRVFFHDGKAQE